jgi:hypothetical protein
VWGDEVGWVWGEGEDNRVEGVLGLEGGEMGGGVRVWGRQEVVVVVEEED